MILTTKARYAVMSMVEMFLHHKSNVVSLEVLSQNQEITVSYLEQIFNKLKKAQLVNSVKGPKGGYVLTENAGLITIASITKAVEESIKMTRCSSSKDGCMRNNSRCKTHNLWEGLGFQIENYLNQITIQDVAYGNIHKENNYFPVRCNL